MKICIASKNRAETMTTQLFFNPKDILIFVEPQEIKKYQIFNSGYKLVNIKKNNKGIAYARNFILNYMSDKCILMADDDYQWFGKRNKEGRYDTLKNCQEMVNNIEKNLKNCEICGISDNSFSYFVNKNNNNKRIYFNDSVVRGIYGINIQWLKKKNIKYDEKLKCEIEDIDINIMIIINKGKTCIDYKYSRKDSYRYAGGLTKERGGILTLDILQRNIINNLAKKYGTEFFSTSHDQYGNLKTRTLKFKLIIKRSDIVKKYVDKYNKENEQRLQSKNS